MKLTWSSVVVSAGFAAVLSFALSHPALAQGTLEPDGYRTGYGNVAQFGGDSSVGGQLKADDVQKETWLALPGIQDLLGPWFTMKDVLRENSQFAVGFD